MKVLYENSRKINYYNDHLKKYHMTFNDDTEDYIREDDIEMVEVSVTELAKLKVLSAAAEAKAGNASTGAMATPLGAQAFASANGAEASASAALVEHVIEASARAVTAEAQANAGVGLAHLGAYAGASVTTAKVDAGLSNIPFAQVSAQGPGAGAETGVSWKYTGGSFGAHAGEAQAGPFAVRAGVKFGAGIRNGVPEVDLGPVTLPCSIM
ncbi:uncharacterized protein LOC130657724 isoform X2 [Hydractinia symbiolongicarpus]|uniref:uncharacterized protein LOC130657724 isoform X2 n=1 Tax=Hydractinia symbiolongicarpus TaxID=13093 RepID=UPI002551B236|nr:uncharacterized protein LOC130657724 isoform X2 [Hydractinia symbiolongicarpus]